MPIWVPGLRIYLYIYLSFFFSIAYCAYNSSMSEYRDAPIYTIINYLCTYIHLNADKVSALMTLLANVFQEEIVLGTNEWKKQLM